MIREKLIFKVDTTEPFTPVDLPGLKMWLDPTDTKTTNALLSADFDASNNEYFSSTSADFDKGDESFSFGGWIKFDSIGTLMPFLGKWDDLSRSYILVKSVANKIGFVISSDGSSTNSVITSAVSANTWYFVVGVYDSVNDLVKISLNGGAFTTSAHSGGAYASATPNFRVGLYNGSIGDVYLDGVIDAEFFYDKALSQSEVNALYNSGSGIAYNDLTTAQKTDLVSWWMMNESSGTRYDAHGSNDLTDNNTVGTAIGKIQEDVVNSGDSVYTEIDKSGNGSHMIQSTITSQFTWDGSKSLVGNGSTRFGNLDALLTNVANDTTGYIFGWVKPTDATPSVVEIIFSFGDTNNSTQFNMQITSTGLFRVVSRDNGGVADWILASQSSVFSNNTWSFVGVVQNGTKPKLYVDGVEITVTEQNNNDLTSWLSTWSNLDNGRLGSINYINGGDRLFLNGEFGQWVAGSGVPTDAQILALYNLQKSIYQP